LQPLMVNFESLEAPASPRVHKTPLLLGTGLGFVAGWSDVLCVTRFQAFAGQLTGNSVYLGRCIMDGPEDIPFYLGCILSNMMGVALFDTYVKHSGNGRTRYATVTGFVNLGLFVLTELVNKQFNKTRWQTLLVCAAMGAQNAVVNFSPHLGANTVIVTGNLQKIASGAVQWIASGVSDKQRESLFTLCCIVAATIAGAFVGAAFLLVLGSGDWIFIPIAVLQCAILMWHDHGTETYGLEESCGTRDECHQDVEINLDADVGGVAMLTTDGEYATIGRSLQTPAGIGLLEETNTCKGE